MRSPEPCDECGQTIAVKQPMTVELATEQRWHVGCTPPFAEVQRVYVPPRWTIEKAVVLRGAEPKRKGSKSEPKTGLCAVTGRARSTSYNALHCRCMDCVGWSRAYRRYKREAQRKAA